MEHITLLKIVEEAVEDLDRRLFTANYEKERLEKELDEATCRLKKLQEDNRLLSNEIAAMRNPTYVECAEEVGSTHV